jgi:TIR domain
MATQLPPLRIFCGYAHEDKALFEQLKTALAVPIRQEAVSVWHYGDLLPGAQWESEIERELNTADIILLLISPAFIASDYCWSKEMQWAIARNTRGDARVIPILGKTTSDWKTTPLGTLQALPTEARPICTWRNRDEAFANVADGLLNVIHQVQQEDKYPVREYVLGLRPSVYESEGETTAQSGAKRLAEQWIKTVSDKIGGTLQETIQRDDRKEWILTDHQQACHIKMQWNYRGMDRLSRYFRSADIFITSQHPALIDRMVKEGHLPYWFLQWTLDDLDVVSLACQIFEETGEGHLPAPGMNENIHLDYTLYRSHEHPVRAMLSTKDPSSPARICLIHDNSPLQGFSHAHTLFSIRKVLAILRGKFSYREIRQIIEEACKPYKPSGVNEIIRWRENDTIS